MTSRTTIAISKDLAHRLNQLKPRVALVAGASRVSTEGLIAWLIELAEKELSNKVQLK